MKAFCSLGVILICVGVLSYVQSLQIRELKIENARLVSELEMARVTQRADRETCQRQLKIIREASDNASKARKNLAGKAGLSDSDWLADVLASGLWDKDSNSGEAASGVDAGTMPGAGSAAGTATGKKPTPIQ